MTTGKGLAVHTGRKPSQKGRITMYYIVRVYDNATYDREFWDLDAAAAFMASLACHCELYAWLAGVEKYMGDNGR